MTHAKRLGVLTWCPIGIGVLTRRYSATQPARSAFLADPHHGKVKSSLVSMPGRTELCRFPRFARIPTASSAQASNRAEANRSSRTPQTFHLFGGHSLDQTVPGNGFDPGYHRSGWAPQGLTLWDDLTPWWICCRTPIRIEDMSRGAPARLTSTSSIRSPARRNRSISGPWCVAQKQASSRGAGDDHDFRGTPRKSRIR